MKIKWVPGSRFGAQRVEFPCYCEGLKVDEHVPCRASGMGILVASWARRLQQQRVWPGGTGSSLRLRAGLCRDRCAETCLRGWHDYGGFPQLCQSEQREYVVCDPIRAIKMEAQRKKIRP